MCDEDNKEVDVTLSGEWDVNLEGRAGRPLGRRKSTF